MKILNKSSKIIRKMISTLIVISMIMVTPMSSFATYIPNNDKTSSSSGGGGLNDNTSAGGAENVGNDPVYAHKFMAYPENQGYRISIVSSDGNRVTNSVDIVNYVPSDIQNIGGMNSIHDREVYINGYAEYKDYLGGIQYKDGRNKDSEFIYSNGIKTEEFIGETWQKGGIPEGVSTTGKLIETHMYTKEYIELFGIVMYNKKVDEINEQMGWTSGDSKLAKIEDTSEYNSSAGYHKVVSRELFKLPLPSTLINGGTEFTAGGNYLMKLMKEAVGTVGLSEAEKKEVADLVGTANIQQKNIISFLVNLRAVRYDKKGESTSTVDNVFTFTESEDRDRVGTEKINEETGEKEIVGVNDIVTEKGYKVIIEPIYWFVPEVSTIAPNLLAHSGGKPNFAYMPYVMYGTSSYLSKYCYENFMKLDVYPTEDDARLSWAGPNWATSGLGVTTLMVAYEDKELKIQEPSSAETPIKTINDGDLGYGCGINTYDMFELGAGSRYMRTGYSVHVYDNLLMSTFEDTGTPTWDDENYPEDKYQPAPAPSGKNFPTEEDYVESKKDHEFNIVKFYGQKQPDGSYKYTDNKTRKNTIHTVTMNDEPGYVVDNYFTSSTFKEPNSKSTSYDEYKTTLPEGSLYGDSAGTITIGPEETDTTLYLRLAEKPEIQIVKYFPDNSPKVEIIDKTGSYDAKEPGYTYQEDKQTPDKITPTPDSWDDTPSGSVGSNEKIPVKTDTKTIYIRYDNTSGAGTFLTLHQDELAKSFTLENLNTLLSINHYFANREKSGRGDHGYYEEDSDGDSYWVSDWRTWYREIYDNSFNYVLSNHNNYASTTFIGSQGAFTSQELGTVNDSGTLGMGGGNTNGLTPNLKFSIYRDSAKDNITLYPNKNTSVKGELAQIGIHSDSYKPEGKRVQKEGTSQWYSQFTTNYAYDTEDNTLSWDSSCSEHGDSGSWNANSSMTLADFNKAYSQSGNILSKAYLGKAGKGEDTSTLTASVFNILSKNFSKNLSYKTGGDMFISFYPYTKMNYQTVSDETLKDVYVTSENLSEVRNISAVEAGVYQSKSGYGIEISSEQWSTHVRAIEGLKASSVSAGLANKSLIPGGATIDLKSANSSSEAPEVWVGLRTYELSIPDSLVGTLNTKDGVKTTSEAKANANQFIEDAKSILSQYQLEKWIMEGVSVNETDLNAATAKKVSGINPVSSFGGNNLSKDSKYYLKTDGTDGSSAKFDVINTQTEQHVYNISSDTQGRVSFKKDGTEIASDNIKQSKGLGNLLSNEEVNKVDERTKIVSNFIKSLDFEGGSNRGSQPWYYEAQDGLEAVETLVGIQVGFGGSSPIRSEVVDVKLTGKLDGKSDILNFNPDTLNEKTRTVQYRMSDRSTSSKASDKPNNYVGTFNGLDITIPGMNTIMRTRLTYMGNNTVQDLN